MPVQDSYLLLTGATGLLGRSLLRDLSAAGRRVAVLVRGSRTSAAASRVDELLEDWREMTGESVACPVVLEGDITLPGLGLTPAATAWVARHVDEVVHSAASLSFQMRESDGEPWNSNVNGTQNVLDMCRSAGIRRYHHVSSAYVCGTRRGRILETELDVGQKPGNDYEHSKITSELAATSASFLESCTVHRPSIIVGDLVTGFTNTFHGFYKPLRIVQPFVRAFLAAELESGTLLEVLGMTGEESKNLVPVDWVSAVMTRIIQDRSLHGQTYHLTAPRPTSVGTLSRVFGELVVEMAQLEKAEEVRRAATGEAKPSPFDPALLARLFGDQMHVYRAYWSDDPRFDSAATERIAPDLPAPEFDDETLRRLCRFAIEQKFRWPPPGRVAPRAVAREMWEAKFGDAQCGDAQCGGVEWAEPASDMLVGVAAVGAGGGQWTVAASGAGADSWAESLHRGLPSAVWPVIWLGAAALEACVQGRETAAGLAARGALVVEGGDMAARERALGVLQSSCSRLAQGAVDGVGRIARGVPVRPK